jgi:hypothetical protein
MYKYYSTYLFEHPSFKKYRSLTRREKNGITMRCLSSVAPADRHMAAFKVDR